MTCPDLKPCPACEWPPVRIGASVACANSQCQAISTDGAKWNALPRRGTGAEMEELRAALAAWQDHNPDIDDIACHDVAMRIRRAIDAVLASAPSPSERGYDVARLSEAIAEHREAIQKLTKERDELRAEVARYIRDRVCDCDEMCQGMRLAKERDEALNKAAVLGQDAEGAHHLLKASEEKVRQLGEVSTSALAKCHRQQQQIAALKELVREFAREGGDGK